MDIVDIVLIVVTNKYTILFLFMEKFIFLSAAVNLNVMKVSGNL